MVHSVVGNRFLWMIMVTPLLGCATAPVAVPATAAPVAASQNADEVAALRQRLANVERRLAELDNRLALSGALPMAAAPYQQPMGIAQNFALPHQGDGLQEGATVNLTRADPDDEPSGFGVPTNSPAPGLMGTGEIVINDATLRQMGGAKAAAKAPAGKPTPPTTTPATGRVEQLYGEAQALFKANDFVAAKRIFDAVVAHHAAHALADNALYWSGRCLQQSGDHKGAIEQWRKLPLRYARSPKVPDALFGMAVSHEASGEMAAARTLYAELVAAYPSAERTSEAQAALARIPPS
jgi:TolA-binding protein